MVNSSLLSDAQAIIKKADYESDYTHFFDVENILIRALEEEKKPETIAQLAHYYSRLDRVDEAISLLLAALQIFKKSDLLYANLGVAYTRTGDKQKAKQAFINAIHCKALDTQSIYNYCVLDKGRENKLESFIYEILKRYSLTNKDKANLYYSLGEIFHNKGDYKQAYEYFSKGAQEKETLCNYSNTVIELKYLVYKLISSTIDGFKKKFHLKRDELEPELIFIVGVPRSGSTLLEQILSVKENVLGLGETTYFPASLNKKFTNFDSTDNFIKAFTELTLDEIHEMKIAYLSKITQHLNQNLSGKIIIDKLLGNFENIGFIKLLFPEAKIIFTQREPKASAWSSFRINFKNTNVPYSYSFENMNSYYDAYNNFKVLWEKNFEDIITFNYDKLISNPELEINKLLKELGIDWDSKYLNFHNSKKSVQSASAMQVRRALYKDSSSSWKYYHDYLPEDFISIF
ncbi:MAG: sulfotransferase [Candidatus Caenarcaniphilales bacterium]|nr:sulfotransferase [Candidatus Caenarcaniphilales bacterium]